MMVLLLVGALAVFFAVAYKGSSWLMRQRRENIETVRSCPAGDMRASRGGKGRFMG